MNFLGVYIHVFLQFGGFSTIVSLNTLSDAFYPARMPMVPQENSQMILFFVLFFVFFRAVPMAYGGSQARDRSGAAAAGLHHSHSSVGSGPCLSPTPQPMAMPNTQPVGRGQGLNLCPHGY